MIIYYAGKPVSWWKTIAPRAESASAPAEKDDEEPLQSNPAMHVGSRRTNRAAVPVVIAPEKFVVILEAEDESGSWAGLGYTFHAEHQRGVVDGPKTACQIGKVTAVSVYLMIC